MGRFTIGGKGAKRERGDSDNKRGMNIVCERKKRNRQTQKSNYKKSKDKKVGEKGTDRVRGKQRPIVTYKHVERSMNVGT